MSKPQNKQNNFLIQGSILAMAGIIVRIIGMLYRIPLTHIIGDTGNSLYDNAYSVYSMVLIISSYSIPVAVSKMIAAKNSRKEYINADRIFKGAFVYAFIIGAIAAIFCYVAAPILVKAESAVPVLRVLSPVIFFAALLGVVRGLFQGNHTMVPTSLSQIIEQLINAIVSVLAACLLVMPFRKNGPDSKIAVYGAAGSTLGTGAGVLAGLLFILFVYIINRPILRRKKRHDSAQHIDSYSSIIKMLLVTITPVVFSTFIYNVSPFIDNYLIFDVMKKAGNSETSIQAIHGIYTGKYLLLVNVPVAIANALSSALLPSISAAKSRGETQNTYKKIYTAIKFTMIIAIPCTVGLTILGGPIVQMLFGDARRLPAMLFRYGSIFVVLFSLSTVTNAVLQATDYLKIPVIHSSIALVIHTIVAYILLSVFGLNVWALMLSTILFALILCILNAIALRRKLGYCQEKKTTFIVPIISAIIMGIMVWATYYICNYILHSNTISILFSVIAGVLVYFIALVLFNGITEDELQAIPKGAFIIRIAKKMHIM